MDTTMSASTLNRYGSLGGVQAATARRQRSRRHLRKGSAAAPLLGGVDPEPNVYDVLFSSRALLDKRESEERVPAAAEEPSSTRTVLPDGATKQHHQCKHSCAFNMLNSHSTQLPARIYKCFITNVILLDIVMFILSTDPRIQRHHAELFHWTEGVVSTIFLVEYVVRMIVVVEKRKYRHMPSWKARIKYSYTVPAVVDLLAILPFFLEIPTGLNLPTLTYLRVRLFVSFCSADVCSKNLHFAHD